MPGLRNEDYVAFLDESGEDSERHQVQVVAGVLIPARWLRAAERRWQDFVRNHLGSSSGRTEVKSRELFKGQGVSIHAQSQILARGGSSVSARAAGRQFYRDALEHIAHTAEVRVLAVGLRTKYPRDAYRLWFWMMYASLVESSGPARPRLPLTVIDGEDASFRAAHDLTAFRFYRAFSGFRPYIRGGQEWFVGGSAHQDSALHPFVQTADLVAAAARHAICGKEPLGRWYAEHLVSPASLRGRDIDVSAHALSCLQVMTPDDAVGSGWDDALIAT